MTRREIPLIDIYLQVKSIIAIIILSMILDVVLLSNDKAISNREAMQRKNLILSSYERFFNWILFFILISLEIIKCLFLLLGFDCG